MRCVARILMMCNRTRSPVTPRSLVLLLLRLDFSVLIVTTFVYMSNPEPNVTGRVGNIGYKLARIGPIQVIYFADFQVIAEIRAFDYQAPMTSIRDTAVSSLMQKRVELLERLFKLIHQAIDMQSVQTQPLVERQAAWVGITRTMANHTTFLHGSRAAFSDMNLNWFVSPRHTFRYNI
jgi:hypothetical protein